MYALYNFRATVVRVIDGDTAVFAVDHGMRIRSEQHVRLLDASLRGVNTPEKNAKDPAVRAKAMAADARTRALLPAGTLVLIHTEKSDDWDRWLASIQLPDGRDLGTILLQEGLATPYHRAPTPPPAAAPVPTAPQ